MLTSGDTLRPLVFPTALCTMRASRLLAKHLKRCATTHCGSRTARTFQHTRLLTDLPSALAGTGRVLEDSASW